ncbi:MAG: hypothetical protein CAPSK01_003042 [Candidatus Accumulibacter vicinus]|uniref:Uncharacterized protein n=1 Tax=Candidatus Accumulibacter vicinus TaxID=2954382 RepID=A0A084XYQ5_9PROT|nr:MAG: hypothetical protein CAPSK01_003042 [Candidatus Accumulibacter vicinus]
MALAALKSDKTRAELRQQHDGKRQWMAPAVQVLGDTSSPARSDPGLTKRHAKIGPLTLER